MELNGITLHSLVRINVLRKKVMSDEFGMNGSKSLCWLVILFGCKCANDFR